MSLLQVPALNLGSAVAAPMPKRFIILHTVEIPSKDLDLLREYGKVCVYDASVESQIPIKDLKFDYLILNLNDKAHRRYYDGNDTTDYNVVVFISFLEQFDAFVDGLEAQNKLTDFPERCHHKEDYDRLLLAKPSDAPNKCLSGINFCSSFLESLKKR